jgi:hypothetical protein
MGRAVVDVRLRGEGLSAAAVPQPGALPLRRRLVSA